MNRRLALLLLIACVSGAFRASGEISITDQMQLGDGLYDRGMYELALREYLAVLSSVSNHPRTVEILYRVGESYRQLKRVGKAVEYFAKVESEYPTSPYRFKSALRRAEILDGANKTTEVCELLDATLAAKPPADIASAALFLRGTALAKIGKTDAAAASYAIIVNEYSATPLYTYALLALGGLKAAEPDGAVRAIQLYQLAASKPATPRVGAEAWFQIGSVYFKDKSYSKSAEAFGRLVDLYPNDSRVVEARLPRAWALFRSNLPADALRQADLALGASTSNETSRLEEWLYLKANCQRQLMKPADAVETYSKLLERFPEGRYAAPAEYERVVALFNASMFKETIREAKPLLATSPNIKDLYWLMAESYLALKDEEGAIQYYRLIMQKCPDSNVAPDAGYRLGHLLQKREEFVQAAEVFSDVAEKYPTNEVAAQALFAAAVSRGKAGKQEEAVRDWSILLQKHPGSTLAEEARYQKAMGEIVLRRDDQAMASLRDLLEKHQSSRFESEARYWLGVLLDGTAKSTDAEAELRRALAAKPGTEFERRIKLQLAIVLQKTKKPDESAVLLSSLLNSPVADKIPLPTLQWLAEYHLAKRDCDKAVDAAMSLAERSDDASWKQMGLCLAGRALVEQGKTEQAREILRKALEIPGSLETRPEAAWRLAEIELQDKHYAEAMTLFEDAAKLASDERAFAIRMRSYFGIGKLLKGQGNSEEAAKYFMSVAVLFDDATIVPQCLFEAGTIFKQLGRAEESAKAFKELEDRYPESSWAKDKNR